MYHTLQTLYPYDTQKTMSQNEAFAYCEKIALSHYENFTVGSMLIPKKMRPHIYNVYAFCRVSDDLGDEIGDSQKSFALLDEWSHELDACISGKPIHPIFIALKDTIRKFDLPLQPFQDLIKAFKIDQFVKKYRNFEELMYYCNHSANPVGRIFLALFGYRDEDRFLLSDATCTALQLANFWQDISVDFKKGRIYIPFEDMQHYNYTVSDLESHVFNDSFIQLMKFEIARTQELFYKGLELVKKVEGRVQLDIELFSLGGLQILHAIENINYDVLHQRPALSKFSKGVLTAKATLGFLGRKFFK